MKFYWVRRVSIGLCYSVFALAFSEAAPLWNKAPKSAFVLMCMSIIAAIIGSGLITSLIKEVQSDMIALFKKQLIKIQEDSDEEDLEEPK